MFAEDVSPIAAIETAGEMTPLTRLIPSGRVIGLLTHADSIAPVQSGWQEVMCIPVHQMICDTPGAVADNELGEYLDGSHEAMMLQLARLTEPGPFELRTWKMGAYYGVIDRGRLLAMAGERIRLPGWIEVSGVCSHPDARGKGYAGKLVARTMVGIHRQGCRAFLHVRVGSPSEASALGLYERLGFSFYQSMAVQMLIRL